MYSLLLNNCNNCLADMYIRFLSTIGIPFIDTYALLYKNPDSLFTYKLSVNMKLLSDLLYNLNLLPSIKLFLTKIPFLLLSILKLILCVAFLTRSRASPDSVLVL